MCGTCYSFSMGLVVALIMAIMQATAVPTPVRKCSNDAILPLAVHVNNCTDMPCDLWKGYDNHIFIQFVANRNSIGDLTAEVQMTTLGIQIPMELEEEHGNVCKNLLFGAYCPLDKGEDVTYHLVLPITDNKPEVPTKVQVDVWDSKDNSVVSCFVMDARIRRH